MGGQKQTGSQTQSTSLDPQMQQYRQAAWDAANKWANTMMPGASPYTAGAAQNAQGTAAGGQLGTQALSGDPAAVQQLMNPYQQQVIDAMQRNWGSQNQAAQQMVGDQAQSQNAFGGSRQGVAQGTAQAQTQLGQSQQLAGLLSGGYQQAENQASQLGWQGLSGNQQLSGLGDYLRNIGIQQNPAYQQYNVLNSAVRGLPYGQTQTANSSTDVGSKIGGSLLQGAGLGGLLGWQPFK